MRIVVLFVFYIYNHSTFIHLLCLLIMIKALNEVGYI